MTGLLIGTPDPPKKSRRHRAATLSSSVSIRTPAFAFGPGFDGGATFKGLSAARFRPLSGVHGD